eukprot:GFUD01014821.1.p1 GENE.GFUD01014821.1~~GFUD01014821.1.p1  ORF type:complete len:293 (+),score=82.37 GFUD01014821.1:61-879(+)
MATLGSFRSFKSVSSTSTFANGLSRKPINRSQLSLYDKISRNLSIFDPHPHKGEGRSRKSSRQRSVSDVSMPKLEELTRAENKCYETEEFKNTEEMDDIEDNINLIINKKHLETITENQNSPYSTQSSQSTTRRMSEQSILADMNHRGSIPFTTPIIELFHENELDEDFVSEKNKYSKLTSTGSSQSNDSGVSSSTEPVFESTMNEDVSEGATAKHDETEAVSQATCSFEECGSPSPTLPRRRPVVCLAMVDDIRQREEEDEDDVEGAPVYV